MDGKTEPPSRAVGQQLTGHCDQIVTVFLARSCNSFYGLLPVKSDKLFLTASMKFSYLNGAAKNTSTPAILE